VELSEADALALGADAIAPANTADGRWYLLRGAEILDAPPRGDLLTVRVGPGFVAVATSGERPYPGPGSANRAVLARLDEPPGEVYTYVEVAYRDLPDLYR
jgi:hypothetical protein